MKKKKKRKLYHFSDMIKDNINFIDMDPVTEKNTGKKGYRYLLSNPLTEEQKTKLSKYDNVVIQSAYYRYAPEIKHDVLILMK